jgi:hypothetical protein
MPCVAHGVVFRPPMIGRYCAMSTAQGGSGAVDQPQRIPAPTQLDDPNTQSTGPVRGPAGFGSPGGGWSAPPSPGGGPQSGEDEADGDRARHGSEAEPYEDVVLDLGSRRRLDSTPMLRAALTIGLVFALVVMVFLGLLLRLPPGDFALYVAPLTGIAGLALGYWFGSDRDR